MMHERTPTKLYIVVLADLWNAQVIEETTDTSGPDDSAPSRAGVHHPGLHTPSVAAAVLRAAAPLVAAPSAVGHPCRCALKQPLTWYFCWHCSRQCYMYVCAVIKTAGCITLRVRRSSRCNIFQRVMPSRTQAQSGLYVMLGSCRL